MRRRWVGRLFLALLLACMGTAIWQTHKPLAPGTHIESAWQTLDSSAVDFIADVTSADAYGRPVMSQAIFDEVLRLVGSARELLVLDFFLFDGRGAPPQDPAMPLRPLAAELRDALIARKRAVPGLRVLLITDPVNDVYGGAPSRDLAQLREAGIDVVVTDLDRLRDSNFLYSSLWRVLLQWWDVGDPASGWLPNPLSADGAPISFAAWARLVNFKANHRKVAIADDGDGGLIGIVTSANPHDASSAHSNVALRLRSPMLRSLLASETEIARFSGWQSTIDWPRRETADTAKENGARAESAGRAEGTDAPHAQILTEGAIRSAILSRFDAAGEGDAIDIAMFYLADRGIVEALLAASRRGVMVRLILDPNKDAFGHTKSGIPNRPVAGELVAASSGAIRVRWYRTHGEQFHAKLVMVYGPQTLWLTLGSANLTRRNLQDYNLEANVALEIPRDSALATKVLDYFQTLWSNRAALGIEYTADFEVYADPSQLRYWAYRITEALGLATY